MGFYHFSISIFQFSINAYGKLQYEGLGMCTKGRARGNEDVDVVFENHVAGIFVRDLAVIL